MIVTRVPGLPTTSLALGTDNGAAGRQASTTGDRPRDSIAAQHRSGRTGLCNRLAPAARHTAAEMFWHLLVAAVIKWIAR